MEAENERELLVDPLKRLQVKANEEVWCSARLKLGRLKVGHSRHAVADSTLADMQAHLYQKLSDSQPLELSFIKDLELSNPSLVKTDQVRSLVITVRLCKAT